MNHCFKCSRIPVYSCLCSQDLMCKLHLWDHLLAKKKHKLTKICFKHRPKTLNTIRDRLDYLYLTRTKILNQTFEIQQEVKSLCNLTLTTLDSIILDLKSLLTKIKLEEADVFLLKSISKKQFKLESNSMTGIKKYYSHTFLREIEDDRFKIRKSFLMKNIGGIASLTLTNDQKFLITGGSDTVVRIWDLNSYLNTGCLFRHISIVTSLATNKKDDMIISGGEDCRLILWSFQGKKVLKVLKFHHSAIISIKVDNSDTNAFSADNLGNIQVWKLNSFEIIHSFNNQSLNSLTAFSFIRQKFFKTEDKILKVFNIELNLESFYHCSSKILCFHMNANEIIAFLGLDNGSLVLVDSTSCMEIAVLQKTISPCVFINTSKNNHYLVAAHLERTFIVYSIETCEPLKIFESFENCSNIEILNDFTRIVFTNKINLFEVNMKTLDKKSFFHSGFMEHSLALASDKNFMVYINKDLSLCVWDIKEKKISKIIQLGPNKNFTCLALSPSGKYLLAGSSDCILTISEFPSYKTIKNTIGLPNELINASWSNNDALCSFCCGQGIMICNIIEKRIIWNLNSKDYIFKYSTMSNCSRLLALITTINQIIIFNTIENSFKTIQPITSENPKIIRFSNNLSILVILTYKGRVICFNITTLKTIKTFPSLSSFQQFSTKSEDYKNIMQDLIF